MMRDIAEAEQTTGSCSPATTIQLLLVHSSGSQTGPMFGLDFHHLYLLLLSLAFSPALVPGGSPADYPSALIYPVTAGCYRASRNCHHPKQCRSARRVTGA